MTTSFRITKIFALFIVIAGGVFAGDTLGTCSRERVSELDSLPITTQFSPIPSGKGWQGEEESLSKDILRDTVDNIFEHGFAGLQTDTDRPASEETFILDYAQSKGMILTHHTGPLELFTRTSPANPCVYSVDYPKVIHSLVEKSISEVNDIRRLYNVFPYQDGPFHLTINSFGYGSEVKNQFKQRYGYEPPIGLDSLHTNFRKRLDVFNFRSDYFRDGWIQVYKIIKEIDPSFKVVMSHNSHNTFGAGCHAHAEIAVDDVFHWGGDFADMFLFNLYPYMMFDYRYGEPSKLMKPRISQLHYCFAQMRNLTYTYGKDLGFWFGSYNPTWFGDFLGPELKDKYWTEREVSATAVAQGANFLITGYKIPIDAHHWDSLGEGLCLIRKAGKELLKAPKVKAKACMLFPRTQYIQLQEEYFNVGLSFELFLRAFGELDILHEEQITDENLHGYDVLVMFDVKLLPEKVAKNIALFVEKGGVLIADSIPTMNEYCEPMQDLTKLFGVRDPKNNRIKRRGTWVPYRTTNPIWKYRPEDINELDYISDKLKGVILGQAVDLDIVSARGCHVTTGRVLIETASGQPGIVCREIGDGKAFLLGFCLQDTYFKTWKDDDENNRTQLRKLIQAIVSETKAISHIFSANPDIEAAIRANTHEGFLFLINHEAKTSHTTVVLHDLPFKIGKIVNLADGQLIKFRRNQDGIQLEAIVPLGETSLYHVLPPNQPQPEPG